MWWYFMANWWYWVTLEHKRVDSSMGHLTLSNMMSAGDNIFNHLILSSPGAQWNYFLLCRGRRITRVAGVVCCTAQLAPTWDVKQSIAGCVSPGNFWVCKLSSLLNTACRRHVHSAENKFRWHEYRSAINQIREISLMQWPEPVW